MHCLLEYKLIKTTVENFGNNYKNKHMHILYPAVPPLGKYMFTKDMFIAHIYNVPVPETAIHPSAVKWMTEVWFSHTMGHFIAKVVKHFFIKSHIVTVLDFVCPRSFYPSNLTLSSLCIAIFPHTQKDFTYGH